MFLFDKNNTNSIILKLCKEKYKRFELYIFILVIFIQTLKENVLSGKRIHQFEKQQANEL